MSIEEDIACDKNIDVRDSEMDVNQIYFYNATLHPSSD